MQRHTAIAVLVTIAIACQDFLVMASEAEQGLASYYADSLHGNPTASGEPYDKNSMTAATSYTFRARQR